MKMNIEMWDIERVIPYAQNVKIHTKEQVSKIAKSIKEFGWDQPIVVDGKGEIIKGHGRRLGAIELGFKKVPVLCRSDLSPEQVRAARLADNQVALGDVDTELLRMELQDIVGSVDLTGIFDDKELDFSVADLGTMNETVFVTDADAAVDRQEQETKGKVEIAAQKRIPIAKALGFKEVAGADEIHISRFIAAIEHQTGKTGAEAFIEHASRVAETA